MTDDREVFVPGRADPARGRILAGMFAQELVSGEAERLRKATGRSSARCGTSTGVRPLFIGAAAVVVVLVLGAWALVAIGGK